MAETPGVTPPRQKPTQKMADQVIAESEPVAARANTPTNWWRAGLIGLAIVIAVLLALQLLMGAPGTDVQPGTPTAEPVVETPASNP
ncbi:hypothetical protein PSQ90_04445 [Devosia rhodophyticola]|uniref:Uncharacterized protein n=1 Tax=Devosia rhodophyticola TaxID=3026423 RepID=A0ABY7YZ95_9HYPH|nr:hypothetical protein [Devosia rhodophyticola]WDR06713.1 hypothetical protein PSQ90_04445 [Devosia rhodophyticola]